MTATYSFKPDPTGEWDYILFRNGVAKNRYGMGFNAIAQLVDRLNGSPIAAPGEIEEHVRTERAKEGTMTDAERVVFHIDAALALIEGDGSANKLIRGALNDAKTMIDHYWKREKK